MAFFNNNSRDSRDSGPREMHDAVCAECNKNCQVPFKPTGDKPIKCSDCFKKSDPGGRTGDRGARGGFGDRGGRSTFSDRPKPKPQIDYTKHLESISAKMDKIIRLLETGSADRPEGTTASRDRAEHKEEKQSLDPDGLKGVIDQSLEG